MSEQETPDFSWQWSLKFMPCILFPCSRETCQDASDCSMWGLVPLYYSHFLFLPHGTKHYHFRVVFDTGKKICWRICLISFLWKIHLPSTVQKYSALAHKIWEMEEKHERTRLFPNPVYASRDVQRTWNTFCSEDYHYLLTPLWIRDTEG